MKSIKKIAEALLIALKGALFAFGIIMIVFRLPFLVADAFVPHARSLLASTSEDWLWLLAVLITFISVLVTLIKIYNDGIKKGQDPFNEKETQKRWDRYKQQRY